MADNLKVRELWIADSKQKAQNNKVSEIAATGAELSRVDNIWNSVTTTWVDGTSGSGTAQFVFKDVGGVQMASAVSGVFYMSELATGLTADALDNSLARLTNGYITLVDTGVLKYWTFVTSATGLLGLTVTSNADSYWCCFVHPTGKLVIGDEMTITG